jgi:hypothetical protein
VQTWKSSFSANWIWRSRFAISVITPAEFPFRSFRPAALLIRLLPEQMIAVASHEGDDQAQPGPSSNSGQMIRKQRGRRDSNSRPPA